VTIAIVQKYTSLAGKFLLPGFVRSVKL
jgi:hypothetical protein